MKRCNQASVLIHFMVLSGLLAGAAFAQSPTLKRADVLGGVLSSPVAAGRYMYIGTGVTVTVWDMADPTHPAFASRTNRYPEEGPITGLTVVGKYLYAGWNSGITIYSLDNPISPHPVARFNNYINSSLKQVTGLASANGYLYVGDANNGLIVVDVTNPLKPKTSGVLGGIYEFDAMAVYGSRLLTTGTNFIGDRMVHIVDISNSAAPVELGYQALDGFTVLRAVLTPGYAIGVGVNLQVYDLRNPAHIVKRFDTPIRQATHAIRRGDTLYLIGSSGIQVWDFTTPAAPKLLRTVGMGTFAPDEATNTPFGPVILTHTDRGLVLGVSDPVHPVLAGKFTIPFGVSAHAASFDEDHMYVAEEAYGLNSLDTNGLELDGRYSAALPLDLAQRDMEDVSVNGGRAYLAAWGYGVLIVDVSNPAHPSELGRFPFSFATAIKARGNRVYVASATDLGILKVLDVSNPKSPVELGALVTDQTLDLAIRGDYAYLATRMSSGPGGLAIVDVSNPSAPVQVGRNTTCVYAYGIDVSKDGKTTYIACADGSLEIIDTSNKANPVLLGSIVLPGSPAPAAYAVALSGTTVYVGNDNGVDEVDVSNPKAPAQTVRHKTGFPVRKLAHTPDGRLFAFAGLAGTYEFTPVAP
jgi:hypothetical protein